MALLMGTNFTFSWHSSFPTQNPQKAKPSDDGRIFRDEFFGVVLPTWTSGTLPVAQTIEVKTWEPS